MPTDLYTTKDVANVRELLLKQQKNIDPITGEEIPKGQVVLDHCHKTQYVRAALHRQSNVVLGKLENMWTRYLSWWYKGTLPEFLRGCANYLEKEHPKDYTHPKWLKKVQTELNKLSESQKRFVLESLGLVDGKNGAERKKLFQSVLKSREYTFEQIMRSIHRSKGEL